MASFAPKAAQPDFRMDGHDQIANALFSPLEWLIITIAQRDTLASVRHPGRLAIALGSVFDSNARPGRPDPRLEMLRSAAVLVAHGHALTAADIAAFTDAGFSRAHLGLLFASLNLGPRCGGDDQPIKGSIAARRKRQFAIAEAH